VTGYALNEAQTRFAGLHRRDASPQPTIEALADIPPLAWMVDVGTQPRIVVGTGVDIRTVNGRLEVSEGCWEGEFSRSAVDEARHLFGSGIVVDKDGVLFCTASHTLEALYVYRNERVTLVSNSYAFLIKYAKLNLDSSVCIYRNAHTVRSGIRSYEKLLYSSGNDRIFRFVHCNFRLRGGEFEILDKREPPRFPDFGSYRDYLLDVLRGVRDNAASSEREQRYRLVTTVSSGYDSVAAASLGAALGCVGAVTLTTGKRRRSDSGRPIADALGLPCVERERRIESTGRDPVEADFIVSFDPGDSAYTAFADILPRSLLLIGDHGDALWNPSVPPSDCIERKDTCGMGLQEFRLQTNFVTVPIVFIGALRHRDVQAISLSDEMRPFSVGGDYDRPIPRRIAEEAGVPRALFGQRKEAVNVNLFHGERMMSKRSQEDIAELVASRASRSLLIKEAFFRRVQFLLDLASGQIDSGLSRNLGRIPLLRPMARQFSRYFAQRWGTVYREYFSYVLIWALTKVGERYEGGCSKRDEAADA
jgi:hypothetical protein